MDQPEEPLATTPEEDFSVPWSVADTWLGLFIFVLVVVGQVVVAIVWHEIAFSAKHWTCGCGIALPGTRSLHPGQAKGALENTRFPGI